MDTDSGLNGDTNTNQATTSQSRNTADQQGSEAGKDGKESVKTVPFHKLFFFADTKDVVLMVIGFIAALGNGMAMPLMTLLIGKLTDAFGQNAHTADTLHDVSQV